MQYRPAHGNDYPADIQRQAQHATLRMPLEGKTKGAPSRHDIHTFITAIEEKMNEEAEEESE